MRSVFAISVLLAGIMSVPASAATYTTGGFTYEQDSTPDQLQLLGNGASISGATFSAGTATRITSSVAFQATSVGGGGVITGQPGFDPSLSLGRQAYQQQGIGQADISSCHYACAVNLPSLNNGATTRHGLELSWSGGRYLTNGAGNDFVIYESGSPGGPEVMMVALRLSNGTVTDWRFQTDNGFTAYTSSTDGAFATAFDLSSFGLDPSAQVTAILIANMKHLETVDGTGKVLFNNTGSAPGGLTGSGSYDPDPLYVGILSALDEAPSQVPLPAALPLLVGGLAGLGWLARRRKIQKAM